MSDEITPERMAAIIKDACYADDGGCPVSINSGYSCEDQGCALRHCAAALERCAELDEKLRANLADFDRVKARAHEVVERARVIGEQRDKAEERCAELERQLLIIAEFDQCDLRGEWEHALRDIIRSMTDCARRALAARQQPGDAGEATPPAPAPSPER